MKVSIEGTPKEINELLQVIVSNQEQGSDTVLSYDAETGIGITITPEGKKQTKVTGDLVAGI